MKLKFCFFSSMFHYFLFHISGFNKKWYKICLAHLYLFQQKEKNDMEMEISPLRMIFRSLLPNLCGLISHTFISFMKLYLKHKRLLLVIGWFWMFFYVPQIFRPNNMFLFELNFCLQMQVSTFISVNLVKS